MVCRIRQVLSRSISIIDNEKYQGTDFVQLRPCSFIVKYCCCVVLVKVFCRLFTCKNLIINLSAILSKNYERQFCVLCDLYPVL